MNIKTDADFDLDYTARKMLEFEEGKKLTCYRCTEGYLTVGIGCNLDADPRLSILHRELSLGASITEKECTSLFEHDLVKVYANINKKLPDWRTLKKKYQLILINMFFQLKSPMTFQNTIKAMYLDKQEAVAGGILQSKWAKQTPNRCNRLAQVALGTLPSFYK